MKVNFKIDLNTIKEMLTDEQNRLYVIGAATLVVSVFYLSFIIIPKTNELAKVSRAVRDLRENVELVESRVKKLDETDEKLRTLRNEAALYVNQLPAEKEIPGLLEGLAAMAIKSGVNIQSVVPYDLLAVEPKASQDIYYREMPLLLMAKSGYHQVGEFISNLEGGNRLVTVEDLRIQYDDKNPRMHNVRILLKTYVSVADEKKKVK